MRDENEEENVNVTGEEKFRYESNGKEYVVTVDEKGELRRYENGAGRGYKITKNGLERILSGDADALAKFKAAFAEDGDKDVTAPSGDTESDAEGGKPVADTPAPETDAEGTETDAEHGEATEEQPDEQLEEQTAVDGGDDTDATDTDADGSTTVHETVEHAPVQEPIPGFDTPSGSAHAPEPVAGDTDGDDKPCDEAAEEADGQMKIDFDSVGNGTAGPTVVRPQQAAPQQPQFQVIPRGVQPPQPPIYPTQPAQKPKKPKKPVTFGKAVAGGALGAVVVLAVYTGLGIYGYHVTGMDKAETETSSTTTGQKNVIDKSASEEDSSLASQVAAKAVPSVASITVSGNGANANSIVGGPDSGSIGSGVLLDKDGNILTNYHVVEYADGNDGYTITAKLGDKSYEAKIIGKDASSDLAVIKIDAGGDELTPIEVGSSDKLSVGDWVMSIGSPFGNEQSVSTGIVSAKSRDITMSGNDGSTSFYCDMIQTDAAINPGNSGGALVNEKGELVGINSIIESSSSSSAGVGFAIPSDYAIDVVNTIISGKEVEHPRIGATVGTVTPQMSKKLGLGNGAYGAYVNGVTKDSPADKAGIKKGDVITKIDGEQVDAATSLITSIRNHKVGDKVMLTILRDGKEQEVEVELASDATIKDDGDGNDENGSVDGSENSPYSNLQKLLKQYLEEQGEGDSGDSDGFIGLGTRRNG
mgnify:CR=1 FL=1